MDINAIILAAGKGTRMKSELPKCAYPLLKKPMIKYIIEALIEADINDICVVIGHQKEIIQDILKEQVTYAYQEQQLGTGHAVKCAEEFYQDKEGITLIFPGDMPLIGSKIIKDLINNHLKNNNDLTVLTTILDNPFSYGRIYKENDKIVKIIEEKEASENEKQIKEINTGLYCINTKLLKNAINQVKNNNNKKEYYLTDIVEILSKDYKVNSMIVESTFRIVGINDILTLDKVEEEYNKYIVQKGIHL